MRDDSEYFVLEYGGTSGGVDFVEIETSSLGEAPRCTTCGRYLAGREWLPPFAVELERRSAVDDDVLFGPGMDMLVSAKFRDAWHACGLGGLSGFEPAEVVGRTLKPRGPARQFFHVRIARVPRAIDLKRSGVVRNNGPLCESCLLGGNLLLIERIVLEEAARGESPDLFLARGLPGVVIASRRFSDFSTKHGMRNVALTRALEFRRDWRMQGGAETGQVN